MGVNVKVYTWHQMLLIVWIDVLLVFFICVFIFMWRLFKKIIRMKVKINKLTSEHESMLFLSCEWLPPTDNKNVKEFVKM